MTAVFAAVAIATAVLVLPYVARVIVGPSVFDRLVALNGMGTKIPALLVVVGLLYGQVDLFVDVALALFLLNLVITLLLARYVRERGPVP